VEEVSEALTNAEKGSTVLAREQRMALAKALQGFISILVHKSSPERRGVLNAEGWDARASWAPEQWECWETWGWFRHFCRFVSLLPAGSHTPVVTLIRATNTQYATQLKSNQITFESGPLAGLGISEEGSPGKLVYETWSSTIGRSST
jgi:hypothetical protein